MSCKQLNRNSNKNVANRHKNYYRTIDTTQNNVEVTRINEELLARLRKLEERNTFLEKKLVSEQEERKLFNKVETDALNKRISFLSALSNFVNGFDYTIGLFGGFLRRVMEPRSCTREQYERFISELRKSDIDLCISYNCKQNDHFDNIPDLQEIFERMVEMGIIDIVSVDKNEVIGDTWHMGIVVIFKGTIISLDVFNQSFNVDFFGEPDYNVNMFQMSNDCMLSLRKDNINKEQPFEILKTMLDISVKTANMEFRRGDIVDVTTFNKMSSMISRQKKIIDQGYTLDGHIVTSKYNTSNEKCCICLETKHEKNEKKIQVSEQFIAPCSCFVGISQYCSNCIEDMIDRGETKCPVCRQQMKMVVNESNINKKFIFPTVTFVPLVRPGVYQ